VNRKFVYLVILKEDLEDYEGDVKRERDNLRIMIIIK
jgi:hypothetical protein